MGRYPSKNLICVRAAAKEQTDIIGVHRSLERHEGLDGTSTIVMIKAQTDQQTSSTKEMVCTKVISSCLSLQKNNASTYCP